MRRSPAPRPWSRGFPTPLAPPSTRTDGEDRWVWEWDDRKAILLLDDEGLVLKVFSKGMTPFSE